MIQKGLIAGLLILSAGFCAAQRPTTVNPAPQKPAGVLPPAGGQQPAAQPKPAPDPNGPVMSFQNTEHDFGTINQDDNGTYLFLFTNTGKEPLVISGAKGSCGCTVPSWPKRPIDPGKMDTIKVTYDTHRTGVFTKTVTITSNAKESPDVIKIMGKVLGPDNQPAFPTDNGNAGVPYTNNWGQ